jgi:hypothetical protein
MLRCFEEWCLQKSGETTTEDFMNLKKWTARFARASHYSAFAADTLAQTHVRRRIPVAELAA